MVLQSLSQDLLIGRVRLESVADLREQLPDERKARPDLCPSLGLLRELPGLFLYLHTVREPSLESLHVNGVYVNPARLQLPGKFGSEMQQNVLVAQVVWVQVPRRIGEHDVVEVRLMQVLPDAP